MTKKTFITIGIILFILLLTAFATLFYPTLSINNYVKKAEIDNSIIFTSNGQHITWNNTSFEKYILNERNKNVEFITTSYNPISPVVSLVQEPRIIGASIDVAVYHLQRTGIISFNFYDSITVSLKPDIYTYQQALDIAKKYDLTKTNPDPANITVYPAPSREEVQRQKQITEREDRQKQLESNLQYNATTSQCYKRQLAGEFVNSSIRDCFVDAAMKYGGMDSSAANEFVGK